MQITQKEEEHAKKFYQEQCSLINEYIDSFYKLYERKPLEDEINSNIGNQIDEKCLARFLQTYDNEMV